LHHFLTNINIFLPDITCEAVSGTSKQPGEDGEEDTEVETTGFKLTFTFKENPYFTNTVSAQLACEAEV
jgi:hypothetical protein